MAAEGVKISERRTSRPCPDWLSCRSIDSSQSCRPLGCRTCLSLASAVTANRLHDRQGHVINPQKSNPICSPAHNNNICTLPLYTAHMHKPRTRLPARTSPSLTLPHLTTLSSLTKYSYLRRDQRRSTTPARTSGDIFGHYRKSNAPARRCEPCLPHYPLVTSSARPWFSCRERRPSLQPSFWLWPRRQAYSICPACC